MPSKLRAPRVRPDALPRVRLLARLAFRADVPLVTVSGAAGYGKTTLIRQWMQDDDRPFAWVSLDSGDNDPVVLLRYVAAALDDLEPLPAEVLSAVAGGSEILLSAIGRAIASERRPFILVLDDIHLLTDAGAWAVIEDLIELIPEGSQLVLSGRRLAGGQTRRRMHDGVLELTETDLRFSDEETRAVLAGSGVALDAVAIDGVTARTEGWPAGVYLAVLAIQDHSDPVGLVDGLHGDHRLVAEYFRDELLRQLPSGHAAIPVHTSILDRASGRCADACWNGPAAATSWRSWLRRGTCSSCHSTTTARGTATTTCSGNCCCPSSGSQNRRPSPSSAVGRRCGAPPTAIRELRSTSRSSCRTWT